MNNERALIADNDVTLEPISADAMPDLPLLIGPGANMQEAAYLRLLDVAPALKPQIKAATWVGNRRWNLTFDSGETLLLPEGAQDAAAALVKFAQADGTHPLLGKGFVRFDMRDPDKFVARKPGEIADRNISIPDTGHAPESDNQTKPSGLITALDIGSSKVSAMIAQKGDGGELIVLGTGQRESRGVKRGYIAD
eukprot:gene67450-92398_t